MRLYKHALGKQVKVELTKALYRNYPAGFAASILNASILFWVLYKFAPEPYLLTWYLYFCFILFFKIGLWFWYQHTQKNTNLLPLQHSLYIFTTALNGIGWGIIGSIMMPSVLTYQIFVILIIVGMIGGSVQSNAPSYVGNLSFLIFALLPLQIWLILALINGSILYLTILILTIIYMSYTFIISFVNYNNLSDHIILKIKKHENAEKLALLSRELEKKNEALQLYSSQIQFQAIHDPLTGLYNRRFLEDYFIKEIGRAARANAKICILMMDIDDFKHINDTQGHKVGDIILIELSNFLIKNTRTEDIVCRYGGEEFIIVMPDTSLEPAFQRADHIRKKIKDIANHRNNSLPFIHVSIGISEYPQHGVTLDELIRAADNALYKAKESGKDRIYIYQEEK